jgi:class 3 adenylate cyclase
VLFADLIGSTELGEQDPERTRAVLDRFYEAMASEIEAAGGTVEKFAGDAVMAAFGAPAALEDHAERALHAAFAMLRRLEPPLQLRIGVNTGDVVVGQPREGSSFVTGDAVNVAARLEQAAAPGQILAGERTVAAARGAFEFDEPQTVEAKGKADGVPCRRVIRALTLMRPRGVGGLHEAFVGREREIELLLATYRRAVERGEPHLVTIMGDAGVGKTRLVRELWGVLQDESPAPMRRTGRCLSYGRGITYWPLAEMLKEHFGIADDEEPERVLERLRGREILGLALGLDVSSGLHPLVARDHLHEAAVRFFEEQTAQRPLVVLVEDLHWAEEELLDLVDRLVADVQGPLFLIATSRPEILDLRPAWGGGKRNVTLLGLEPLTEDQTEEMVSGLLASELPVRVRNALVERAGGNPFFVEELVATLIDHGVLARSNGGWNAQELPEGFEIPDSVHGVLAARIDLLPPIEKGALQAAAVVGRVFWPSAVETLVGGDPNYELLEQRDFIRRRPGSSLPGEREFAIKHALTREVAYSSLPKARRARLHAALAEWIERSREARDEYAALLGHHYAEAVRAEDADLAWAGAENQFETLRRKALHWLERAADLAVGRYEIDDGLSLLQRALELADDRQTEARMWHSLGRAYAFKFDGPRFWDAMQKAIEFCDDETLRGDLYADLALQTASRIGMWPVLPESEVVMGWIDRALELAPPESEARAKAFAARSMWSRAHGRFSGAEDAVEASALAERLGNPELRVLARTCRVFASYVDGDFDEALTWAQGSYELIDDVRDPDVLTDIHATGTLPAVALGRFGEARRMAKLHEEVASKLTSHHRVHGVAIVAEVEEIAGGWATIAELEPIIRERVSANLATPCIRNARTLLLSAIAAEFAGDREHARELEESAREVQLEGYGMVLVGPEMRLALVRGDLERLEELVPTESGIFTWFGMGATLARLDALSALGDRAAVEREATPFLRPRTLPEPFALRALGRVREDENLLRQALERFEAMGLEIPAAETRALLA